MSQDLNDYLTGEERRQMNKLLAKAEERRKEKGEEDCKEQFIMMACHCECGQTGPNEEERDDLPNDMENLLDHVCNFCKKHNMCPECSDEQLPF